MEKSNITFKNVRAWFEGKYRYKLYYSATWGWLMRTHIRQQIAWRISIMDGECLSQGSCKLCGCQTTALQMAKKACDKPCYPKLMNERAWKTMQTALKLTQKKNPVLFQMICGN